MSIPAAATNPISVASSGRIITVADELVKTFGAPAMALFGFAKSHPVAVVGTTVSVLLLLFAIDSAC